MKHTAGPWIAKRGCVVTPNHIEGGAPGANAGDYYGNNLICETVTPANARLIAQAPELLWLVESFVALYAADPCSAIRDMLVKKAQDTLDKLNLEVSCEASSN